MSVLLQQKISVKTRLTYFWWGTVVQLVRFSCRRSIKYACTRNHEKSLSLSIQAHGTMKVVKQTSSLGPFLVVSWFLKIVVIIHLIINGTPRPNKSNLSSRPSRTLFIQHNRLELSSHWINLYNRYCNGEKRGIESQSSNTNRITDHN